MAIADQKNFVTGLLYVALGGVVAVGATNYSLGTAARMGPGYFPMGVGLALVVVGVILTAGSLMTRSARVSLGAWPLRSLLIVSLSVVLFALVVEPMGLIFAIPVLIGVSSLAHPGTTWRMVVGLIVVLLPMTWLLFIYLLGLRFPVLPFFMR